MRGAFSISADPCPVAPATLAVGAQCVLEIAFMPTQFVSYTGTITVTDNVPAAGKYADDQPFGRGRRGALRYVSRLRNCHEFACGNQLPDDLLGRVRRETARSL